MPSYLKKIVAKSPKIILKPPRLELKNSSENEKNESKKSQNPKNRLKCGKTGEKRAKSEMSFCQPEVKIGQIIENIEEIGPKLLKSKTELRQNDGFLDLVAAEGERGDPPRSTVFEVDTIFDTENGDTEKMSKNSVVLTSREPGLETQILLNNTPKKATPIFELVRGEGQKMGGGGSKGYRIPSEQCDSDMRWPERIKNLDRFSDLESKIRIVQPKVMGRVTDGPSNLYNESSKNFKVKKCDKALTGVEQGPSFNSFEVRVTPANKDLASNLCDQGSNIKSDANVNSIEMQGFVDASSIDMFKMLKSDSKIPPKSESQKVIELNVKEKTLMFEQRCHLSEYNFNSTNLSSKSMPDEDDRKSKCSKVESTVTEINENSGRKLENARMNVN